MKVLLIDADSTIPNLALMRLSAYHKKLGDMVDIMQLHIPYLPVRNKETRIVDTNPYDKIYCSIIFDTNKDYVSGDNIVFGGTGVSLNTCLSDEIEKCSPDYSIYPDNDISYGFMTRGCIRHCYFCKVPEKEGGIHLVHEPEDIVRFHKTKFLDNNILAYNDHKRLLQKIIDMKVRVQFNQGLDIRLLDEENSELLHKLRYIDNHTFAFDDIRYRKMIDEKFKLLSWCKPWRLTFFVYVHPSMQLSDTIQRINWARERDALPFVMRDVSCWYAPYKDFYTDLASWCNQPHIFIRMGFEQFIYKRHPKGDRADISYRLYKQLDK